MSIQCKTLGRATARRQSAQSGGQSSLRVGEASETPVFDGLSMIGELTFFSAYHSYLWIMLFMIATGCGLPLPEEVAIVWAGVESAPPNNSLEPWLALTACVVGGIIGDCVMYGIGRRWLGWVKHHPRVAKVLHVDREIQMERLIARHGLKIFFAARFMVGVRGPLYIAAGMLRMPFRRFLMVDLFCATTVIGLFFWLSYFIGDDVKTILRTAEWWITGIVAAAILGAIGFFVWRHRRANAAADALQTAGDSTSEATSQSTSVEETSAAP